MANIHTRAGLFNHHTPTNYWHLIVPDTVANLKSSLDANGVTYLKSSPKAKLEAIHVRFQRGFLDYNKCSVEELRRFCTDRNLHRIPKTSGKTKPQVKKSLISRLETADENTTFDKLSDLPPELRVEIYEHYFRDLETTTTEINNRSNNVKSQPPITKVSRLLRKEALPIFYQTCTFQFNLSYGNRFESPHMQRLLENAPKCVLDQVKKVKLDARINEDDTTYRWSDWTVEIDPKKSKGRPIVLKAGETSRPYSKNARKEMKSLMQKRLKTFLGARGSKKTKFHLRLQDRNAIVDLLRDV